MPSHRSIAPRAARGAPFARRWRSPIAAPALDAPRLMRPRRDLLAVRQLLPSPPKPQLATLGRSPPVRPLFHRAAGKLPTAQSITPNTSASTSREKGCCRFATVRVCAWHSWASAFDLTNGAWSAARDSRPWTVVYIQTDGDGEPHGTALAKLEPRSTATLDSTWPEVTVLRSQLSAREEELSKLRAQVRRENVLQCVLQCVRALDTFAVCGPGCVPAR